ncbi:MAG: hypothetical protein WBL63_11335 [Candidatus Acidiferrum sp.]
MKKERIERNLLFPSRQFRDRVRSAARERGFRSEQAFILAACSNELERGDGTEAMDDLEARIVATLLNMGREVQSLFTLVHTQVALTNCLLQYVLTCVAEPPEDVLARGSRASKAEICEDPPPGRSGSRNAKQSHSGAGPRQRQTAVTENGHRFCRPRLDEEGSKRFPQT